MIGSTDQNNLQPTILQKRTYIPGDTYSLNLNSGSCWFYSVNVTLQRLKRIGNFGGTINNTSTSISCTDCSCLITNKCKTINVPIVGIIGQVTVDFSDVGDVIFRICDKYQYYREEKILCNENKCTLSDYIEPKDLKQTKFHHVFLSWYQF